MLFIFLGILRISFFVRRGRNALKFYRQKKTGLSEFPFRSAHSRTPHYSFTLFDKLSHSLAPRTLSHALAHCPHCHIATTLPRFAHSPTLLQLSTLRTLACLTRPGTPSHSPPTLSPSLSHTSPHSGTLSSDLCYTVPHSHTPHSPTLSHTLPRSHPHSYTLMHPRASHTLPHSLTPLAHSRILSLQYSPILFHTLPYSHAPHTLPRAPLCITFSHSHTLSHTLSHSRKGREWNARVCESTREYGRVWRVWESVRVKVCESV